jgi:hypothetical protein
MATISIDYESSQGDVELILEDKEDSLLDQAEDEASKSGEQINAALYNVGVKFKELYLRVSSLRLASSSEYFRAMLEGSRFPEGKRLKETGFVQIRLSDPEDEPEAIMIILGVLYENDVQLPTKIDFQTLQKVAVLVDKYQWHKAMTPHMISWFDSLRSSPVFPRSYSKDVLTLLWIAWLFGMKDQFKTVSGFAQQHACKPIDPTEEDIRLPKGVVGKSFLFCSIFFLRLWALCLAILYSRNCVEAINNQRDLAFQAVETLTNSLRELSLQVDIPATSPESTLLRAMIFGFMTFSSQNLQLGEFSTPGHAGWSVRLLESRINSLINVENFTVCPQKNIRAGRSVAQGGIWDLKTKLQGVMTDLKIDEWGLDYDCFKPTMAAKRGSEIP